MLRCIREVHAAGILHRDIKPGDFLLAQDGRVVLIDFGLAVELHQPVGQPPPIFFGTTRYGSLNARGSDPFGPRDDLISWFYTVVEMITGNLPWSRTSDEAAIWKAKQECSATRLCKG